MTFLPIVERELRVAARRRTTYRVRFLFALAVVAVWLVLVQVLSGALRGPFGATKPGPVLFVAFGVLALAFSLLSGIGLTADCLSEEKREGTLGLLFLTDLRGYDVVLGKLIATSINAAYGLLAIFPVLGLPLLMGGVTIGEFWRLQMVLVVTMLLSLSLGMFVSALSRETREAMSGTILGMLALAGIMPAMYWMHAVLSRSGSWGGLLHFSPVATFAAALDDHYRTRSGAREFWASLETLLVIGAALLGSAAVILPRVWSEGARSGTRLGLFGRREQSAASDWAGQRPSKSRSLQAALNPYHWLAGRPTRSQRTGWLTVCVLFGLWFCFMAVSLADPGGAGPPVAFIAALFTSYALHQAVKALAAAEATRQLSEDRRSGALELLLVSPIKQVEILAGHRAAFHRKFARAKALLFITNLAMLLVIWKAKGPLHMGGEDQAIFSELFIGGMLMIHFDFKAFAEVGAWMGLRAPRHQRAVLGTLGRVMAVSWIAVFLVVFFMYSIRAGTASTAGMLFALWFAVGICNDLVVTSQAQAGLAQGFRYWLTGDQTQNSPFSNQYSVTRKAAPAAQPLVT